MVITNVAKDKSYVDHLIKGQAPVHVKVILVSWSAEILPSSMICDEKHRKNVVITALPHLPPPKETLKIDTKVNQSIHSQKSLVTIVDFIQLER